MKIFYIGCLQPNSYNVGDWACFEATKQLLGPNYELTLNESEPHNAVILGGGTILRVCSESLTISDKPLFVVGSGLEFYGYPEHPVHPNFHEILKKAKLVGLRGPLSSDFVTSQGYENEVVGDIAMCFDPDSEEHTGKDSNVIGFNIGSTRDYLFGTENDLIEKSNSLVDRLIGLGYVVHKFAMWPEDFELLEKIKKGTMLPFENNVNHVFKTMKQCKLVIGEKLHTSIMAFACGVPFISLAYRHKCLDFMDSLGSPLSENYVKTDDKFLVNKCLRMVKTIASNYNQQKLKLIEVKNEYNQKQTSFFDRMKSILN